MRILILGVSGLIGHKLYQKLSQRFDSVHGTLHGGRARFNSIGLFNGPEIVEHVDVRDFPKLEGILQAINPDVVLNCAGITKRRPEVNDPLHAIAVNSMFPHRLAAWAGDHGKRVIQFSTDCVFDGAIGDYTEASPTTGKDAYGQTKALGEIRYDHCLTIRSSFVGRELAVHSELLDWFLQQRGKTIKGFTKAWYSGISTIEMARIVGDIIEHQPSLGGLHQLAIEKPVSKYELLCLARDAFKLDTEIVPDDGFEIKPTLDGRLLRSKMPLFLPSWAEMMRELAAEQGLYKQLS
jgi:dTDP-4-dehydrorhamnose reductase